MHLQYLSDYAYSFSFKIAPTMNSLSNFVILINFSYVFFFSSLFSGRMGSMPEKGVPDMTSISDIDEIGINRNLKVRYDRDEIYVSFLNSQKIEKNTIGD